MQELGGIGHLVVIADAVLEQRLLEAFLKLGAKGYNCHYCMGKGRHEILEDPFTGRSRVRIEVLAQMDVAKKILDFLHGKPFGRYPLAAYIETVQVDKRDHFY